MKIKNMKFFDELFGPLVCCVFNLYNFIKKIIFRPNYNLVTDKVKAILVIKLFGMGSIILAGPMFRALKAKFPNAKIIILTFSNNKQICQRLDLIDECVLVDYKSPKTFIKSLASAILYLRKKRCDISIDMEFFAKSSALIQYLCNTNIRVGYYLIQIGLLLKMMWRGNLLTHNVYYNPHRHTSEAFLALSRSIGADTTDLSPAFITVTNYDRDKLNALLAESGITQNDSLIVININSSQLCIERRWPLDKFVELTNLLIAHQGGLKFILIGDKQDEPYVNEFFGKVQDKARLFNLCSKLDIGMLAVLLERSKLFITNDSGPLQMAIALNVKTASFFGPEIPDRFGPREDDGHTVFYSGVYCSPCLNVYNQKTAPCNGENICMRKIAVQEVYAVIKERYLK